MTPWSAGFHVLTISQSLLKLMPTELVMPSNHLILCALLLLPSVFPSIRLFFSESALHIRWPKFQCFSFRISPSSEYSGLISFRMDWLDLLAVHGTLQESSPAPQFESLSSSALSLLYGATVMYGSIGGQKKIWEERCLVVLEILNLR